MTGFRFIHAADLHLDSPFKGLSSLPEAIVGKIRESTFEAFDNLIEHCIRLKVDFLLIAGDVYDAKDRSLRAQIRFQQGMAKLASHGVHVYIIHGNHDPEDGYRASLRWPEIVHFFPSDRAERVVCEKEGKAIATIVGRSYPTRVVLDNYAEMYGQGDTELFTIGLLHTNLDGNANHDNYAPCMTADLLRSGIDYWALGHIHTRSAFQTGDTWIVYPGNIQGRSIRETGPRGCTYVEVNGARQASVKFLRTDTVCWEHMTIDIGQMDSEQDIIDMMEQMKETQREQAEGRPVLLRVTFNGRGSMHAVLNDERKLAMLMAAMTDGEDERSDFVWIESLNARTGRAVDRQRLLQEEHVLSELLRYSGRLSETDSDFRLMTDDALGTLLHHQRATKLLGEVDESEIREWLKDAEELAIQYLSGIGDDDDEN